MAKKTLEEAVRRILVIHNLTIERPEYEPCDFWKNGKRHSEKETAEEVPPERQETWGRYPPKAEDIEMRLTSLAVEDHDLSGEAEKLLQIPQEYGLKAKCAESLVRYWQSDRSEEALKSVRVYGKDKWSCLKPEKLREAVGEEDCRIARQCLGDNLYSESALRWHCRGLSLQDSIRRAKIDIAVAQQMIDVGADQVMMTNKEKEEKYDDGHQFSLDEMLA